MPVDNMSFRVVSFGGFNKDDVMQYIDKVNFQTKEYKEKSELTNKRLQKELAEKNEQIANFDAGNQETVDLNEKLTAQNSELTAKIAELEAENERLQKELIEKNALLQVSQSQVSVQAQAPIQTMDINPMQTMDINPMQINPIQTMDINPVVPTGNELGIQNQQPLNNIQQPLNSINNMQQPLNSINAMQPAQDVSYYEEEIARLKLQISNLQQMQDTSHYEEEIARLKTQISNLQQMQDTSHYEEEIARLKTQISNLQQVQDTSHYEEEIARLKSQINNLQQMQDTSRFEEQITSLKVQLEQARREKTTYEDVKDTIVKLEIEAHLRAKAIKEEAIVEGEHIIAQAHVKADALVTESQRNFKNFMNQKDRIIAETRSIVDGILQNSIKNIEKINNQFSNMQKSHTDVSGDIKDFSQRICDMLDNLRDDEDDYTRTDSRNSRNGDRIISASEIFAEIQRTEPIEQREPQVKKHTETLRTDSIFAETVNIHEEPVQTSTHSSVFSEQTRDLYQETPRAYDNTSLKENHDIFRDVGVIRVADNYQDEVKMQVNDMFKESNIFKDNFNEDSRNIPNGSL
ncbi:MAG: hypothetical protein R3Y12_07220 [Clostridia bacterium]